MRQAYNYWQDQPGIYRRQRATRTTSASPLALVPRHHSVGGCGAEREQRPGEGVEPPVRGNRSFRRRGGFRSAAGPPGDGGPCLSLLTLFAQETSVAGFALFSGREARRQSSPSFCLFRGVPSLVCAGRCNPATWGDAARAFACEPPSPSRSRREPRSLARWR